MQKSFGITTRSFFSSSAILIAAILLSASMISVARAAVSPNTATSLVSLNQTIKASSAPTAIFGLNLAGNQTLASTSIAFTAVSGFSTTTDLVALSNATSSGVAIWRDNKAGAAPGVFDASDYVVPLLMASTSWNGSATSTLTFATPEVIPLDDTGGNLGNDYFVVIQTANNPGLDGHTFTASMYPGANGWTGAQPAGPTAITTNMITGDTVAPTLDVNMTGPANDSTGVPVSTFIHLGFGPNEILDQTTLNPNNVTLTVGSTPPVGAMLRPFPNGFDLVVSGPPTYSAPSSFAKATSSSAFFNISGTSQIFPQGSYAAPSRGDIVYTQTDTFPPEVGVITNATLTSGTFAINNNPAFRSLQITKFVAPTTSGYTGGGAVVGVGDLIVANTSANPTNVRYSWHIASTSAAINNDALRLDDALAAPTYATTTFARLMPAATSTIDSLQRFTATTTLNAGDLVFAKVASGADNLNIYAWHLVTTGQEVTAAPPLGATGTTTALRLDSVVAVAPTFAAGSVIAKITSVANGPTGSGPQDATAFSNGDMMFAKTSANAANLNSYAFHLVSNGATGATSTLLRLDNSATNLAPSTTYVINAKPGIKDMAGNALAATSTITFTTGGTISTNTTPPGVQNSQPQMGNQSFAPNGKINLTFSVNMLADGSENAVNNTAVVKLSNAVNGQPVTATSTSLSYNATNNTLTITPTTNLPVSTDLVVQVTTAAKSATVPGTFLPMEYRLYFRTASASDNAAPTILGVSPPNGSTGISMSPVFTAGFSKDMDPATITSNTLKLLAQIGGASITGTVNYSPQSRSASFAPTTQLSADTGYSFVVGAGLTGPADLSGNRLSATSTTFATTTATADGTLPTVAFANADNFGIAITFSEPMKTGGGPNAADNIANYTLESPTGTTISLGNQTITYDAGSKTARLSGLALQNGNQYKVTVAAPVQDLAANPISTSGAPPGNLAFGTVQNSTATGGQLGPGGGTMNFSTQGMNPTRVSPESRSAGVTSNYKVEFLAGTSIPAGGQIQLVFPSGFTITNASTTAVATSFCNADINGPMVGTTTIATVSNDNASGIMTLTTQTAATGANSFVCLDISGVVNSSIPNSSGYTVDIKTRDTVALNRAILETKTSSPFFLGVAGSRQLLVNVFNDGNANGAKNDNEGIGNVRVFLFSPASGGNSTTTVSTGVATFNSLADGDYMIGIDSGSLAIASSTVTFNSAPQPFTISGASPTKNFIVSGGGSSVTISGNVTGPSGTSVDVFATSNNGFSRKTIMLDGSAVPYSIPVTASTTYNVGVGPAMPEAFFTPGAPPPPPPTFTFMPPPNITVVVATTSVTGKNFTLTTASKTITGTVLDSNGSAVSNAGVFARPLSNSSGAEVGFGTGGQTNTSGSFTLNVVPGTYLVGVFKGGMPNVPDRQITVPTTGANTPTSLAFSLGAGTSLTISGTVKDDGGNAIPYAGVNARKVVSTSNTTPLGGGTDNYVGGPTDSNGAYTLYVDAGTWVVEAFAPGFGKLGQKTLTVTTSSLSGQDFSAQTLSLGTITGTTTKESVVQQGVMVRAEGASGANMSVSDANGVYTLKVPAGTYGISCFFPGVGEGTPLTGVVVTTGATTYNNNCALLAPITITVNLTDGTNPITGAYIDIRNSSGRGNGTNVSSNSGANAAYTIVVPPGTYTVRAGHPAYGTIGSTASVSSTQTITYTTSGGALNAASGTVTAGGTAVNGAWVTITGTPTGQTNIVNRGGQTDSTGAFSIQVPSGSYQVRADKPGYIGSTASRLTVAGTTAVGALAITASTQTISGTVTLDSAGVSGAFVDAQE
ncbi:MAG: Ig-like domain-containing protein, partial [Patescibacteria group bacterium]